MYIYCGTLHNALSTETVTVKFFLLLLPLNVVRNKSVDIMNRMHMIIIEVKEAQYRTAVGE